MIPDTDWTPRPSDIAWQENMVRVLKDGAVWGVPMSESVFKIDKQNKTFKLTAGDPNNETNMRIAKVFKLLGYSEQENTPTPERE